MSNECQDSPRSAAVIFASSEFRLLSPKRTTKEFNENAAGELVAERLRRAQDELARITGRITTEDLLGEIFGRFCIGK